MYRNPWLVVNLRKIFGFVIEQDKSLGKDLTAYTGCRITVDQTLRLQWPNEGVVLAQGVKGLEINLSATIVTESIQASHCGCYISHVSDKVNSSQATTFTTSVMQCLRLTGIKLLFFAHQ